MRWNKCLCSPGWMGEGCHTGTLPLQNNEAQVLRNLILPNVLDVKILFICYHVDYLFLCFCLISLLAVCELPCANGGRCVGPDTCQCSSDYTGPQCLLRELQSITIFSCVTPDAQMVLGFVISCVPVN